MIMQPLSRTSTLTIHIGSYVGAGRLISTIESAGPVRDYGRWLDLDDGIARTRWTQSDITFIRYVMDLLQAVPSLMIA
jgi:hypothetical protein